MLGRTKGNFFLGDEVGRNHHQVCVCRSSRCFSTVPSAQMTYADVVVADLLVRLQDEFDAELKLMGGDAGERAKKVRTEHPGLVELAARYHGRRRNNYKKWGFFQFQGNGEPGHQEVPRGEEEGSRMMNYCLFKLFRKIVAKLFCVPKLYMSSKSISPLLRRLSSESILPSPLPPPSHEIFMTCPASKELLSIPSQTRPV